MARHIMAVCVVCLLCADHIPCSEHFETGPVSSVQLNAKVFRTKDGLPDALPYGDYIENRIDTVASESVYEKAKSRRKGGARSRRHAGGHETIDHQHFHEKAEITDTFLQQIFAEYGQSDGTMDMHGFERMLRKLGLFKLVEDKAAVNTGNNNETCIGNQQLVSHVKPPHYQHHHNHQHKHNHSHVEKCSNSSTNSPANSTTTKAANSTKPCDSTKEDDDEADDTSLNVQDLLNLCPVLLYQLAAPTALEAMGCINEATLSQVEMAESALFDEEERDMFYVWIYSFLSVFACGILGLVGVAIIPCMDTRFYKDIIQFLVALAVGTMTGDALLHLLPHSIAGHDETGMIYKGLTCMGGIIFFYAMEHGLTMISEWRKGIKKKEKQRSKVRVMRDPDSSVNNATAGDKLCKSKYSSYPYCYDEIAMDQKNDTWLHQPNNLEKKLPGKVTENGGGDMNETAQSLLSQNYASISEVAHIPDSNTISSNLDESALADGCGKDKALVVKNNDITVILREHESQHHGHSHKHGHVHSPPESLSAVAWMIILGDGLHNFTDGMAIGAAFAENIAGGFSTSLAVFCHELPHELGDFAILIKAGMSAKSAVYYNLLTGLLSFVGMIFGIVFGQSHEAAQWMFAAAAGLFIYIALVDMMPELSTAHKSMQQCLLQIFGMFSGLIIMLLIALYEGDLMTVFGSSPHIHSHN